MLLGVITLNLTSFTALATEKPLRIAVAANFAPVLEKILPTFTQQTGIKTQVVSGATGSLYQQIYFGAPFDIFFAADEARAKQLEFEQLTVANSRHTYAVGEIAFWSANSPVTTLAQVETLLKTSKQRFAIANPDISPYGKAAQQALINLALWPHIQNKLVRGSNINQTFQHIRSQTVSAGIVANSQLALNKLSGFKIPSTYYHPIKQQLVIVKASENKGAAAKLSTYIRSKVTQAKISKWGYLAILQSETSQHKLINGPAYE